eukprot:TRINITY_DN4203_c0_g2_i2.p2 TRINITY_DN4203_c0_g2~~TRINITY_DN4203_c0_g2_i2.p2  ORF type:complete len:143 (+),score=37.14 TRINITY_DN4203_c0_g2_i2:79-507(+)
MEDDLLSMILEKRIYREFVRSQQHWPAIVDYLCRWARADEKGHPTEWRELVEMADGEERERSLVWKSVVEIVADLVDGGFVMAGCGVVRALMDVQELGGGLKFLLVLTRAFLQNAIVVCEEETLNPLGDLCKSALGKLKQYT